MKTKSFIIGAASLLAIAFLLSTTAPASAGGGAIVIIGNKSVKIDKVSKADVKHIFQKEKERIGGTKAMPIHAKKSSPLRTAFNKKILGMSVSREETYWQQKKVKSGLLPPKELGNTAKAVSMVRGAIGYAYAGDVDTSNGKTKILLKL